MPFFLRAGLVSVTMLLEFGPEHLNTLSITPEILASHTWLPLQLRYSLNLYVVSQLTWGEKNKNGLIPPLRRRPTVTAHLFPDWIYSCFRLKKKNKKKEKCHC